jgi:hypothetical protein
MKRSLLALLVLVALPAAAAPKPTYREDARLKPAIDGTGPVDFEQLEKAIPGVPVVVPGFLAGAPILLEDKRRTAADAFQFLADFSLGHWEKVGDAWVLVMDREMIAIAEMSRDQQEKAAKALLQRMLGELDGRRRDILLRGGVLSQANLTIAAIRELAKLGRLGYWRAPYQVSPSAVRGAGITLRLVNGQATVFLPTRSGRAYTWVGIPAQ